MSAVDSWYDQPCSDDPRTWPWLADICKHCNQHRSQHTGPGLDCPKPQAAAPWERAMPKEDDVCQVTAIRVMPCMCGGPRRCRHCDSLYNFCNRDLCPHCGTAQEPPLNAERPADKKVSVWKESG